MSQCHNSKKPETMMTPAKHRNAPKSSTKRARMVSRKRTTIIRAPTIPRRVFAYPSGFSQQFNFNHKLWTGIVLTPAVAGAVATKAVIANGMTIIGPGLGTPSYFNTLTGLYDTYAIVRSTIVAEFAQTSAANAPMVCGIYLDSDATATATTLPLLVENGSATTKILYNQNGTVRITKTYIAKQYFASKGLGDPALIGTSIANPPDVCDFQIFAAAVDPLQAGGVLNVSVTVYYDAQWNQPKDVA